MLLNELDQFVKRELRCRAYVCCADDFRLFHDDKDHLWAWKEAISGFLAGLRLVLHPRKTVVYPVRDGVPFLGLCGWPTHRRLKRPGIRAFVQRLRRQQAWYASGELSLGDWTHSVQSWVAHASQADTYRLRARLFGQMPPIAALDDGGQTKAGASWIWADPWGGASA